MNALRTAARRPTITSLVSPAQRSRVAVRYSSHGESYNQPSGNLFGEKPPPPGTPSSLATPFRPTSTNRISSHLTSTGQKRVYQDWELIYYWGMGGGMALAAVGLYFRPDTSLESWAQNEAKKRMAEKGETPTYTRT